MPPTRPAALADADFCYLTTTGRRTGRPHEIEIWFAVAHDGAVLMMAGGGEGSDWVANLAADPRVTLRIGEHTWSGTARIVEPGTERDALARRLLVDKYESTPGELASWGRTALPVAIEVDGG